MIDESLLAGHTLAAFWIGGVVTVYILTKSGEKEAVGYGPDFHEAMADLWEKMNARRESSNDSRERR